ncbi:hypothetical protein P4L29_22740 [Bacillus cereus]|nr:hypothetical protein [Bacillus cereus]
MAKQYAFTPIEEKVLALSMIGIMERNGIKDHGVDLTKMMFALVEELQEQAGEVILPHEINDHVVAEMRTLLPLFTENYRKEGA